MMKYHLSREARMDIDDLLGWSLAHFGSDAADRYLELIDQALMDIAENPQRPGARIQGDLPSKYWAYHLYYSRQRAVTKTGTVKRPRHFIIYTFSDTQLLIHRVLHDSMDIPRHLP